MARLLIVKMGCPVLRKKAETLTQESLSDKKIKKFLKDLVETMRGAQGVGLAANQVGRGLAAFVFECKRSGRYPDEPRVPLGTYLNPRIVSASTEREEDWEGCLSIPGYRGIVPRAKEITFEAMTPKGELVRKTATGFHARIIQHEIDHLNGLFYVDRMPNLKAWLHLDEFNKLLGVHVRD